MTNNTTCPRCGGMLIGGEPPAGTAITFVEGVRYHSLCGFKEQQRLRHERWEAFQKQQPHDHDFGSAK